MPVAGPPPPPNCAKAGEAPMTARLTGAHTPMATNRATNPRMPIPQKDPRPRPLHASSPNRNKTSRALDPPPSPPVHPRPDRHHVVPAVDDMIPVMRRGG